MLYGQGYTIRGVQRVLKERGKLAASDAQAMPELSVSTGAPIPDVPSLIGYENGEHDGLAGAHDQAGAAPSYSVRATLEALQAEVRACAQLLAEAREARL